MDYIKEFINTKVDFLSYAKGEVWFKTKLALGVAKTELSKVENQDIQRDRVTTLHVDEQLKKYNMDSPSTKELIGEEFQKRGKVYCLAKATLYGLPQRIIAMTRQHSVFGLNKKYVTTEGLPNETAIIKRMRELGISSDVKEARYGRFYNAIFANDFYDNATALITKIYLRYQLHKITEKTDVFEHKIEYTASQVRAIISAGDELQKIAKLVMVTRNHENGAQLIGKDDLAIELLGEMEAWARTLPEETIIIAGIHTPNPAYKEMKLVKTFKIWQMYSYDDGHSKSGSHFGDGFGFIKNRFIIPKGYRTTDVDEVMILENTKDNWFSDDVTVDGFKRYGGFLNCSGLTSKDLAILDNIIQCNDRYTPFLCDQVIDLGITGKIAITTPTMVTPMTTNYNSEDLRNILVKLVNNHRWHEDYLSAIRACKYWLAQPATETVEAHWWTQIPRTMYLPKLGLKRAAFHILLQEEGVCTTAEAITAAKSINVRTDELIVESIFANTCWYWGEYLAIFNKKNLMDLLVALSRVSSMTVDEQYRADALYSAVIGKAVPRPAHDCITTVWEQPLRHYYNKRIPFGILNFKEITDYGYDVHDSTVLVNTIVAPSCVALITGLAGSLVAGTPYGSMFHISPAVKKLTTKRITYGLNYNDLWALGVFSRYQGYNLNYQHPTRNGRHTIYAANDVSIAMPPVTPKTLEEPKSYTVESFVQREYTFGTSTEFCLRANTTLYWSRDIATPQLAPQWNAMSCTPVHDSGTGITHIRVLPDASTQSIVNLAATYDFETADFRVELLHPGVPLPNLPGVLGLEEQLEEKPPEIADITLEPPGDTSL
uniref:Capsid protein n=1 Tax=Uromyces fabae virus TaxID=3069272 RepID=A0AA51YGD1_9VIRU|nr:capsid protein [Uromyces fabae virus]